MVWRKNQKYSIGHVKEIANTWIGEDGWRKVHLSVIVIKD